MEKERFNTLINDPNTVIIETAGCCYFKDPTDTVALFFLFCHNGLVAGHSIIPAKRILVKKYLVKDLVSEIKLHLQPFSGKTTILVNADTFEYALSYELLLDETTRTIKFSLLDLPNMAERFITEEEKEGLLLAY